MKHLKYFSIIIVLAFIVTSCSTGEIDIVPTNPQQGDYFYTSTSNYYLGNGTKEKEAVSQGSMSVNNSGSGILLYITPNLGYSYIITINNLEVHGDTTTFRISMQQIQIQSNSSDLNTFNLTGTNSIPVGNLGNYDGYFTNEKFVFAFKSTNITSYDWVHTTTEATKRN